MRATFERRDTPVPGGCPTALSKAFARDVAKVAQWRAFLRRSRLLSEDVTLEAVVEGLREFLLPVLTAVAGGDAFERHWDAGGPWRADGPAVEGLT